MEWHYCGVTSGGLFPNFPSALTRVPPWRWRAAGLVLAGVMALHALLLGLLPRSPGPGWRAQPPQPLTVRRLAPAVQAQAAIAALPAAPTPTPVNPALKPAAPTAAPSAAPREEVKTAVEPAVETMESAPDPGGQAVPTYRTQLPPAATLQFVLQRGGATGAAELDWRPSADSYQLTLVGRLMGAPFLGWSSQGGFDDNGIAPLRYVESRRGRDVRAANFQRDTARITFSGPSIEHPLVAGAQDRLSWMLQLAGVMAADPALAAPGTAISMWVVGTRGDAEVWTFVVQGSEDLDLPIGPVAATVHLLREPRRPYDTRAQVWLDPARHHLPVQARLRVLATGEGTEFRLRALQDPRP